MSTVAETFLSRKSVLRTLNKYADALSRYLPASMDFEDARQELIVGLIEKLPQFKPERSSPETFSYYVVRTLASNIVNTKRVQAHERSKVLLEESLVDLVESRFDNRIIGDMIYDEIENKLSGKARQLFSHLRVGISRSGCAEIMGISRAYVTVLLKKRVKIVVNECGYF